MSRNSSKQLSHLFNLYLDQIYCLQMKQSFIDKKK